MDIKLQQVSYAYSMGTPFEKHALFDVDLNIPSKTYQAIIGHTGSGKSTILQHFNGLLKPTKGEVHIGDRLIVAGKKAKELKPIRQKVGIVFQFPEHQLFEDTVYEDIAYGLKSFSIPSVRVIGVVVRVSNDVPAIRSKILSANLKALSTPSKVILINPYSTNTFPGVKKTLENSFTVIFHKIDEAIDFSNNYAPEHLIIYIKKAKSYLSKIHNAGSVFIGEFSPESVGDYASGTNHSLPTYGYAKSIGGVAVEQFMKGITFQELSKSGLEKISKIVIELAETEKLQAHANAVKIRLQK